MQLIENTAEINWPFIWHIYFVDHKTHPDFRGWFLFSVGDTQTHTFKFTSVYKKNGSATWDSSKKMQIKETQKFIHTNTCGVVMILTSQPFNHQL